MIKNLFISSLKALRPSHRPTTNLSKISLDHQTVGRSDDCSIDPSYYIEDCRIFWSLRGCGFTNPPLPRLFEYSTIAFNTQKRIPNWKATSNNADLQDVK